MSFRIFDRATRRWVSSTAGVLEPPVFGGFTGHRGEFYGDDVDAGRPVRVRLVWTRHGPDRARWEQAFSYDGARSWEVSWVMDLTREGASG